MEGEKQGVFCNAQKMEERLEMEEEEEEEETECGVRRYTEMEIKEILNISGLKPQRLLKGKRKRSRRSLKIAELILFYLCCCFGAV